MSRIYLIPPLPCLPSSRNYSPRDYPSKIVNRRKNANEIRSFPMKIREGRSEAVSSLPSPSLQKSNFRFTTVYTAKGKGEYFSSPRGEVTKFKLPRKRWNISTRGNGEHACNCVNFASCQTQHGVRRGVVIFRWVGIGLFSG